MALQNLRKSLYLKLKELANRTEPSMKNEYEVFEKFPDGSSLWRDSIRGFETARHRLQKLTQRSENQFYAINLTTLKVLVLNSECNAHGFQAQTRQSRPFSRASMVNYGG
jgi:hypothetical protein